MEERERPWGQGRIALVRIVSDLEVDEIAEIIETMLRTRIEILEVEVEGFWD